MPLIEINSLDHFKSIEKKNKVVLIDFYAPWCGPCKMLKPQLEFLSSSDTAKDIDILLVNVDLLADISSYYAVKSLPTMIFLKDEQIVNKLIGFHSKDKIEDVFKKIQ